MKLRSFALTLLLILASLVGPGAGASGAQSPGGAAIRAERDNTPKELKHVGVDEHLDGQLPLDAVFHDDKGAMVRMGDYFNGERPSLFILASYSCPVLCSMVQHAAATAMK